MPGWLNTPYLQILEKGLDATALRQRVLANNIANVDTPNFKRSDVDFSAILNNAMGKGYLPLKKSSERHLDGVLTSQSNGIVVDQSQSILRNDGNNVDIELEMTWLAENSIQYNSIARAISGELTKIRSVLQSSK